ncbi:MAG: hypothetical protein K5881_09620 [Saccharofermentans sp.]|jgi:hypothetical protein|nr:hypothetical protein [Saccharofermentans sp.]
MKRILATVMAGAMVIGMTACDSQAPTETTTLVTTAAATTTVAETELPAGSGVDDPYAAEDSTPYITFHETDTTVISMPAAFSEFDFGGITKMKNPNFENDNIEFINNAAQGSEVTVKFAYDGSMGDLSVKKVFVVGSQNNETDITGKCELVKDPKFTSYYVFTIPEDVMAGISAGNDMNVRIGVGEKSFMELNFTLAG